MIKTIDAKRIAALLGVAMAALVVLSALAASDAHAKKKHHHRAPAPSINTVQCPNGGTCFGTASADHLIGTENFDDLRGEEGNDVYDGKGGSDDWTDVSTTSNDRYLIPSTEFSQVSNHPLIIVDLGGSFDVLDLSPYKFNDFVLSDSVSASGLHSLLMDGPQNRDILISRFLQDNEDSIDFFKFSDGTFAADQVKSLVP